MPNISEHYQDRSGNVTVEYSDGSVKFAVLSAIIPNLGTIEQKITIVNKATSATAQAETIANMLSNYDFEATIGIAVSGTPVAGAPVSARAILSALTDAGLADWADFAAAMRLQLGV